MRVKKASAMVALSVGRNTLRWISVFLLLIFVQLLASLVLFAGVFILSDEILISPFNVICEPSCGNWYMSLVNGPESEIIISLLAIGATLCLYVPVVLVPFALLAMLFASYAKDRATLWFSMACQAASSLLILTGVIAFLLLHASHVRLDHMTLGFYICVGVQVQLGIATALTYVSGKRLASDWE